MICPVMLSWVHLMIRMCLHEAQRRSLAGQSTACVIDYWQTQQISTGCSFIRQRVCDFLSASLSDLLVWVTW